MFFDKQLRKQWNEVQQHSYELNFCVFFSILFFVYECECLVDVRSTTIRLVSEPMVEDLERKWL